MRGSMAGGRDPPTTSTMRPSTKSPMEPTPDASSAAVHRSHGHGGARLEAAVRRHVTCVPPGGRSPDSDNALAACHPSGALSGPSLRLNGDRSSARASKGQACPFVTVVYGRCSHRRSWMRLRSIVTSQLGLNSSTPIALSTSATALMNGCRRHWRRCASRRGTCNRIASSVGLFTRQVEGERMQEVTSSSERSFGET